MRDRRSRSGGRARRRDGGRGKRSFHRHDRTADRIGRVRPACRSADTARRLNLHSDSSYRFERGVDPEGVDWASRRVCQLILELAGGELAAGVDRCWPAANRAAADRAAVRSIAANSGDRNRAGRSAPHSRGAWHIKKLRADAASVEVVRAKLAARSDRARSIWSRKSREFMATTRFPKTSSVPMASSHRGSIGPRDGQRAARRCCRRGSMRR